ncbi:LAETG motif-containing sortase-dependent surface protein [Streptomyces beijiangensis]|uniref:LPXTG cell wall anchor domain-containing protein n=1 Tax=Streptomyces beijiangensis TaxID=163361 RepID=A0A939JFV8_9ACTN|nr:LAETG motif-containing sortase-dependent surface protein [Streptomyces beijiangensis]MBO0512793.1 LPXTG cell wall anchor domain-containing protein [Streptomyces beijiangensis]
MTVTRGSWRRRGALIAAATAGVVGVGLSAVPAQAHTPKWTVSCDEVSVDLTAYGNGDNTVRVTVDGKDLLPLEHFQDKFSWSKKLDAHDKPLALQLIIDAHDEGYDKTLDETAPVCPTKPTPTPPASETPTPSATPSSEAPAPSASASTSVAPTSAAPAPSTSPANLAETGSSSSTPLIAGTAAVVILAGGGIVWATRKRRSAQH